MTATHPVNDRSHFTLLGVPVRVEPGFFVVAALLGFYPGTTLPEVAAWTAIVFVSILVHEMGHAMAFKAFGDHPTVRLLPFGGLTMGRARRRRWESITVTLAGPLSAIVLLGLPALLVLNGGAARGSADVETVLRLMVWVNIGWSVLNLVPVLPLDGGKVAESLVGRRAAQVISVVVAVPLALWAFTAGLIFAALFVALFATQNLAELRSRGAGRARRPPAAFGLARPGTGPAGAAPPAVDPESDAWARLRAGDGPGARRALERLAPGAPVSPWLSATMAVTEGDEGRAVDELARALTAGAAPDLVVAQRVADSGLAPRLLQRLLAGPDAGLQAAVGLQHHLLYARRPEASALVGEGLIADGRLDRAVTAFDTARAWSAAGDVDRALWWLGDAVDHGLQAVALLDGEPDLAAVRARPGWGAVRARAGAAGEPR
ncbi:MAG: site-2 protease family protein [Acidimicrobiia bacterium]